MIAFTFSTEDMFKDRVSKFFVWKLHMSSKDVTRASFFNKVRPVGNSIAVIFISTPVTLVGRKLVSLVTYINVVTFN